MKLGWIELVGAFAFALNVWGNLELTKVGNRGHIIRLAANACWLIYSPIVGAWALFANHAVFAAINILGYHRWKKLERSGVIGKDRER
jgi:hypothetical protein